MLSRALLIGNEIRIYIKPPSREFELSKLSMRQRLASPVASPPRMRLTW